MKTAIFLAMVVALFTQSTNAEYVEHRRDLTGTVIDRSFIVQAKSQTDCVRLREKIDILKQSIEGAGAMLRDPLAREFQFPDSACFATFTGNPTLKAEVANLDEVEFVEEDTIIQTAQTTWGLDRIDQPSLPLDGATFQGSPTGTGVTVYVIDTGVEDTHPQFGGRAKQAYDAVGEGGLDGNGHGTHCAGTVGSARYGVATGATIKGVKVLSRSGSGSNAGVLNGIRWAVDDSGDKAAVLSMSLGGGQSSAIDNAVRSASNAGNIVVVAAGNDNNDACRYSPAAAGGSGSSGGVITVGSTTSSDRRSSFSNYGSCLDIYAPGSSITSTWINGGTNTISGTSMACPHVAGVAAVLLEKHCGNKQAAIDELFISAVGNKIGDAKSQSPNLLLQVSETLGNCNGGGNPTSTPFPTTLPTPFPTERTNPPTGRPWTCPNEWFGTGDGCDCECGGGDPDCDGNYDRLYCGGQPAQWWERCNFLNDRCVAYNTLTAAETIEAGRTLDTPPSKLAADESINLAIPIAGAAVGFCALVVVGAVVIRRRRASGTNSVTASKDAGVVNPQYDI